MEIVFLGAGVYGGWLLHSHYRYLAYSNDYYGEPDISEIVNTLAWGLCGRAGFQLQNGTGFEFSVTHGLCGVFHSDSEKPPEGYSGNSCIMLPEVKGKNPVIATFVYFLTVKSR